MHILQAVLMGIVQGLSEFLPISSSGHLVFTSNLYKIFNNIETIDNSGQEVFLDIMLHIGTLVAVLVFFRKDIMNIIKAFYYGIRDKNYSQPDFKLSIYIILGTVLTALVAIPLRNISEMLVFMPAGVGILLFVTGIVLILSEYYSGKNPEKKNINWKSAAIIGIAQGIASIPGFSRSGWTIAAALFAKSDRVTAAKYSFLLSIPVILGASIIYPFVELDFADILTYNWAAISLGTIVSGIVGYFCIKYFIKFVEKFSLSIFGYYCIVAGILAYTFFIGKV